MPKSFATSAPGRVVLLNGPSSAGKSSLARAFLARQSTPWHYLPVDLVHSIRSRPAAMADLPTDGTRWQESFRRSRAGYHRMLAGLAQAGNDVVGDHVLSEPWRIADLLLALDGIPTLLVHVTASRAELERRERERGDRVPGTALAQVGLVFGHGDQDLEVDTTELSSEDAAQEVDAVVQSWPQCTAVDRLRRRGHGGG
ncbi:phosphotransferase-like protein [Flexivirga oryzae]|uniref:Chloramphenicol 3-O phosphotransferase n=1 Tax=Flexivirga oryzae TaxID=1794944 RepID=A0A839N6I8_9MICO|nr:AAA family ATPase [Flexivirga oryzae]MBB2891266.1 chloramphenicol 3-O phosphotransferase [Flexivirga oryzae]